METSLRLTAFLRDLESRAGDFFLNIHTHGSLYFDRSGARRDYSDYETNSHFVIRAAIRAAGITEHDIIYELGSGKGRALAHFARMKLRKVVGIELSEELCLISRANMEKLRGAKTAVEVRNEDVIGADLSDATVFYMFNPFGPETMRLFLDKTYFSKAGTKIIYLNPRCRSVFAEFPRLKLIKSGKYPIGPEIDYYEFR